MPLTTSKILEDTKTYLTNNWPKSSYLLENMIAKAEACEQYASEFNDYIELGGTLALRRLVSDWKVMADDAIGGYSVAFTNDVMALDTAHFRAFVDNRV